MKHKTLKKYKKVKSTNLVKRCKPKTKKSSCNLKKKYTKTRKVMKGGNYNKEQIEILKTILTRYEYNVVERHNIIHKFNIISQKYPFEQLMAQILNNNDNTADFIREGRQDVDRLLVIFENDINEQQEGDTDSEYEY